jgi:RNase PH
MELKSDMWSFSHGIVKTAAGSAYLESKTHKVLCTVSCPSEFSDLTLSEESQRHAQAQLLITSPHSSQLLAALSSIILLEKYPKSVIEIKAEVIFGNEETALVFIINAASLAVIDSGIEIRDTLIAVSAGIVDNQVVIGENQMVAGVLVNLDEIGMIKLQGLHSEKQVLQLLQACIDTAKKMFSIVKSSFDN